VKIKQSGILISEKRRKTFGIVKVFSKIIHKVAYKQTKIVYLLIALGLQIVIA